MDLSAAKRIHKTMYKMLLKHLALGLPTGPEHSKYGKEFGVGDFDMYQTCSTELKCKEFLKQNFLKMLINQDFM